VSTGNGLQVATVQIRAFGREIAYKEISPVTLRTARLWAWPRFELEPPPWLVALLVLGCGTAGAAWLVRVEWSVSAQRRPAHAALSVGVAAIVLVPPLPAAAGGGGSEVVRRWLLGDHLGSATATLLVDGTLEVEVQRKPFGAPHQASGAGGREIYAGHVYDEASGFFYMQARWQNPVTGTFLSVDPVVASGADPQSYDAYRTRSRSRGDLPLPARYRGPCGGRAGTSSCCLAGRASPDALRS